MKKLMTLVGHPITIAFMMLLTCGLTMEMIYFDYQAIMKTGTHAVANLEVFEETLALWLVGIGVLLEEREVVTNKVYGDDHPPREEFLDHTCLHHGCGILLVGLGIEMIDQLFSMMHRYHIAAPEPFYFTLPFNFLALVICGSMIIQCFKKPEQGAHDEHEGEGSSTPLAS